MERTSILHADEKDRRDETINRETETVYPPLPPRRSLYDGDDEQGSGRGTGALWAVVVLLIAGVVAAGWYVYPLWKEQNAVPGQLTGLRDSVTAAGKRMDAMDGKVGGLVNAWGSAQEQMRKLESRVEAQARAARRETTDAAAKLRARVMAEVEARLQNLTNRVGRLEGQQADEQSHVARLEREIAQLRTENGQQRALLQQDRESKDQAVEQRLSQLDQRVEGNARNLTAVRTQVERRRVDFEAGLHHGKEVVPGVTLQVSSTSVPYQRFKGWVFVMPDRRTVWIKDMGVDRPLVVYSESDNRPIQLVVTRVTKYSVIGYALVPVTQG